ncbi:hypothetical protein [Tellurirhabdus bombi]|uniref:hypothetical protein n=1 Tax=Tellurirhabdus bombi TaxID=2907205 RepID=UPI001F1E2517|nr:hypothetical protein [Tellurirhabdus bombi]
MSANPISILKLGANLVALGAKFRAVAKAAENVGAAAEYAWKERIRKRDTTYAELHRTHQRMRELAARQEEATIDVMKNHYIKLCRRYRSLGGMEYLPDFDFTA